MISDDARAGQQVVTMARGGGGGHLFSTKVTWMSVLSEHFPCRSPDLSMAQEASGRSPHSQGHSTLHCRVGCKRAATFKGTAVSQGVGTPAPATAQAATVSIGDGTHLHSAKTRGVPGGLAEVPEG